MIKHFYRWRNINLKNVVWPQIIFEIENGVCNLFLYQNHVLFESFPIFYCETPLPVLTVCNKLTEAIFEKLYSLVPFKKKKVWHVTIIY